VYVVESRRGRYSLVVDQSPPGPDDGCELVHIVSLVGAERETARAFLSPGVALLVVLGGGGAARCR
jgi:hypothetical protein